MRRAGHRAPFPCSGGRWPAVRRLLGQRVGVPRRPQCTVHLLVPVHCVAASGSASCSCWAQSSICLPISVQCVCLLIKAEHRVSADGTWALYPTDATLQLVAQCAGHATYGSRKILVAHQQCVCVCVCAFPDAIEDKGNIHPTFVCLQPFSLPPFLRVWACVTRPTNNTGFAAGCGWCGWPVGESND